MLRKVSTFILLVFCSLSFSQNTIGTLLNTPNAHNGYTLFTKGFETYLINNCGQVINSWSSNYPPGNSVYLLEDGSLLRACKINNTDITFGGTGGRIEKYDWAGNLTWEYNYSGSQFIQHHDIYPMKNGNVLMLAVTTLTNAEAIQAGRDPNSLQETILYNEQIIELNPNGPNTAQIVWQWDIKDHLIQDYDSNKDNFGVVSNHPELLDINYLGTSDGKANWMHMNSMQYHEDLDQIVLSSRLLNEIYIIDHSTTIAEASGHSGGIYGKGGDFLYRWGNPQAYKSGSTNDQKLFGQHNPYIIPNGLQNAGKLILFNNGIGRTPSFSEVLILDLPRDAANNYIFDTTTNNYGPSSPYFTYTDPNDPTDFFSRFLSNAQVLPNGNILINSGAEGYVFEIDSNNAKVWKYIVPIGSNGVMTQGDDPFESGNIIFRANRYDPSYSGFTNKNLTPQNPIELNFNLGNCTVLSTEDFHKKDFKVYPNPFSDILHLDSNSDNIKSITIFNSLGTIVKKYTSTTNIDTDHFSSGIYFLKINTKNGGTFTEKIIKI